MLEKMTSTLMCSPYKPALAHEWLRRFWPAFFYFQSFDRLPMLKRRLVGDTGIEPVTSTV